MVATGTQAAGYLFSKLKSHRGFGNCQVLGISIHSDELNTAYLLSNHASNCVTTGTT
jgi:hypothetical protein